MKDASRSAMRAPESAQAVEAARGLHIKATSASENLTVIFINTLELRATHARFAVHFLRALDLKTACLSAGIGYETGRTYLKKLFEVTGSKNQVELAVILGWVVRL